MLGRTNTLFVEGQEDASFELVIQDEILTESTSTIDKIEYLNGTFFVFTGDNKVLCGRELDHLSTLLCDGAPFLATHVIYADNCFYFVKNISTTVKATDHIEIYKSTDLNTFETITIDGLDGCLAVGIYKTKEEKIVILAYSDVKKSGYISGRYLYLCVTDTMQDFSTDGENFIQMSQAFSEKQEMSFLKKEPMIRNRIVIPINDTEMYLCSLNGTVVRSVFSSTEYAYEYLYKFSRSNGDLIIYYSINGTEFNKLGEIDPSKSGESFGNLTDNSIRFHVVELDDNAVGIFFNTISGKTMFTVIETPTKAGNMLENPKPVILSGLFSCYLRHEGFTYIGCSGGLILKTFVDYSGNSAASDIKVLKTLSAKQALESAKRYTDEQFAILISMIEGMHAQAGEG